MLRALAAAADRPRWLYRRKRGGRGPGPAAEASCLQTLAELTQEEESRLQNLFSPAAEEDELQGGLFSPSEDDQAEGSDAAAAAGPLGSPHGALSLLPPPAAVGHGASGGGEAPALPQQTLSRTAFPTQAAWHLEVARRALRASGHSFQEAGSGSLFDATASQPKAPQCDLCLQGFPKARIHALAKAGVACVPVACTVGVPLVKPQRLVPRRVLRLGTTEVHETHSLGHYRGRLWCFGCAATMAVTSRVTTAMGKACPERCEDTARRNVEKLALGELPAAWRAAGWPKGPSFRLLGFQ